jgi:hypothetical protein
MSDSKTLPFKVLLHEAREENKALKAEIERLKSENLKLHQIIEALAEK